LERHTSIHFENLPEAMQKDLRGDGMNGWWGTIAAAAISAVISVLAGVAVNLSITRKYDAAKEAAKSARKGRARYTSAGSAWQSAAMQLLYHLVRIAQKKEEPNGELERALVCIQACDKERCDMERAYAADAQED
jgi:hypothetical protein